MRSGLVTGLGLSMLLAWQAPVLCQEAPLSPAAETSPMERVNAEALTVLPAIGLIGASLATGNPLFTYAVPASFGLGHAYAHEYTRAAAVTLAGPLVAGGGVLAGGAVGYGLAWLSFPGDFNQANEMPPTGTILFTGLFAAAGLALGVLGTWGWAYSDIGRIYDERRLGPLAQPSTPGPNSNAAP